MLQIVSHSLCCRHQKRFVNAEHVAAHVHYMQIGLKRK
jgi:hypothetical protein